MFHCNGWTYTWAVTLQGGTHVCLRSVEPEAIFAAIAEHGVTHMCAAPVVLTMLIHAPEDGEAPLGAAGRHRHRRRRPALPVIAQMEAMGFAVTHLYGLTECYGPATICLWQPGLEDMPLPDKAAFMARQGVNHPMLEEATVLDPATMAPVPADGATLGEVMLRGNTVMKGYLRNPARNREAFAGGWFHTGDLGVHASGRLYRGEGPRQGHRHLRRRERLDAGGRGGPLRPSRHHGSRRRGAAGREMGRGAACLRHADARARRHRPRPR